MIEVQCTEYNRQAGQNCIQLGSFVYVFFKTIFPVLPLFFVFCLDFRGKISIYLSDHLEFSNRKQTLQYMYCMNPTSA